MKKRHKILVAPLDWGLGHTTRCMPIIAYLLERDCHVFFAGNEAQIDYVSQTYDKITYLPLEGYNVEYSSSAVGLMPKLLGQMPRLNKIIKREHEWLKELIKELGIDGVISDNRYGLNNPDIPTVMMTHQLGPMSGMGSMVDNVLRPQHYKYLERFKDCWVVDIAEDGYAGKLSHPDTLSNNAQYIGLLSQLDKTNDLEQDYILVLLSGPEPQRTILADKLWEQVQTIDRKVVFVTGSNEQEPPAFIPEHIHYYGRVTKSVLDKLMQQAAVVVCRSGYSTVMDLVKLGKKAIFIPTPGQTEQEYLGAYLSQKPQFTAAGQKSFDLAKMLNTELKSPTQNIEEQIFDQYKVAIDKWLDKI
ncbi:MAG: glycosyltransferase [Flavipsychrobacter sp.]